MSRYDYRSLSSQDFEELTRDLLQAEWKVARVAGESVAEDKLVYRRTIKLSNPATDRKLLLRRIQIHHRTLF